MPMQMSRQLMYFALLLALSGCRSPTSPGSIQSHLDTTTPDLKVNGASLQPGTTTTVSVGARVDLRIDYINNSGQFLHTALVFVRDDGVERLINCGVSGSGGQGGGFGGGTSIFPEDRGHTVRVFLLGAYGPGSGGPPPRCLLQSDSFQVNRANVQAERLLMTLVVQ
jgi:hypothetical protein